MDRADSRDFLIRAAEPDDAPAISALLGRDGTFEGTLQMPDMPVVSRIEFLQRVDPHSCRLVAISGGEVVGMAGLHTQQPSLRRSHVRGLGIAIAPEWQGRGAGRQLMNRLLDWADQWAGVLRVELWVHVDNERAIALYRSLGFLEEGRHKAYALKNGRYVDSISMARLHPNPPRMED
ncbi:MAG: GNAT family N-acetyltransferase [Pseudomonadota bacterium]|uniref:GNAT family N-acetyltransferase n=1 Tax=Polaromonas sp. TaxID=1869339 RepID=UPI0017F332C6|nr:GNAT family N-acetyltransferase [Polaromonas sp.]MBA3594487.1 GNAT family N-acetyltransferase [Polaromonas sp.]MDQ3272548.1 GNAT family N-acetyltransferase [Pseudomonadota bacterium]